MIKHFFIVLLMCSSLSAAQTQLSDEEQKHLRDAIAEAGNSNIEFVHALESHLQKYPKTPSREELERAIAKAAIELKDNPRIVTYGERVLARNGDEIDILEKVTRALLAGKDKESSEKALKYAQRLEKSVHELEKPPSGKMRWQMVLEVQQALNKSLVYQARASGNLGKIEDGVALARKAYEVYPSAEAARETGKWLAAAGKNEEAVRWYADAFTVADARNSEADRSVDRATLGKLYLKFKPSESGLGDLILESYDRTSKLLAERRAQIKKYDPNALAMDAMEYTLSAVKGEPLKLASLRGKVVILDFWATWCGPCRVQHPLYEEVKKRFAGRDDVVFLAISTDEEKSLVEPFLEKQKWSKAVYFEDGLSMLLKVNSIPATVIFNKRGELASRMNGFVPERFVDMLSDRIHQILTE
jgi:thiol-disulfide isomerase/thioredoxin